MATRFITMNNVSPSVFILRLEMVVPAAGVFKKRNVTTLVPISGPTYEKDYCLLERVQNALGLRRNAAVMYNLRVLSQPKYTTHLQPDI